MTKQQKKVERLIERIRRYKIYNGMSSLQNCYGVLHGNNEWNINFKDVIIRYCSKKCFSVNDDEGFGIMQKLKGMTKRKRKAVLGKI